MGGSILREESGPQRVAVPFLLGEDVEKRPKNHRRVHGGRREETEPEATECDWKRPRSSHGTIHLCPYGRPPLFAECGWFSEMGECE